MSVNAPAGARLEAAERRDLILTMIRGGSSDLRDRALRIGAETLPESIFVALLRDDADDVCRNAGLEMLKLRGRRSFSAGVRLLEDGDDDVVLQAVLLLDAIGDPRAWTHLRPLLARDDENIVQAVITAAGRLGSRATAADVLPFLQRSFWLQLAALSALGNLRSRLPVANIAALLPDADLRETAAEALARIGGIAAARSLAEYWSANEDDLDASQWLPLLAQALAEAEAPLRAPELRARLARQLESANPDVASAAASAILSLGPGENDGRAIDVLVSTVHDNARFPSCLAGRLDLVEWLLGAAPPARNWGFELVRKHGAAVRPDVVRGSLVDRPPDDLALLADLAAHFADTETLIRLHERVPGAHDAIAPLLRPRRAEVLAWIDAHPDLPLTEQALLLDATGAPAKEIIHAVATLQGGSRASVIAQIRTRSVLARLPWPEWIAEDAEAFVPLLGDVVAQRHVRELLPLVRAQLMRSPQPELIAAVGALRDRLSAPLVIGALANCPPSSRAVVFESIAAIGGRAAKSVLRESVEGGNRGDVRLAARALAQHATADDGEMLRHMAEHSDWAVRYAAAEALGRVPSRENVAVLTALAADPAAVVAQRARAWLDTAGSVA